MNLKKFIFSTFITFFFSTLLTTIWYSLSSEANTVSFTRATPNYGLLTTNHLLYAIGFVYLFPFYYNNFKTTKSAFLYGVIVASIMFIPTGLVVRAIWEVEFDMIFIINTFIHILIGGITGVITALIYNRNK